MSRRPKGNQGDDPVCVNRIVSLFKRGMKSRSQCIGMLHIRLS
jgi:hypothetical protein